MSEVTKTLSEVGLPRRNTGTKNQNTSITATGRAIPTISYRINRFQSEASRRLWISFFFLYLG